MKDIIVIHHNDPDGFSAAWVAWKKFKNKATYIPAENGNLPPAGLKNKEIYFVDFCYKEEELKKVIKNNKKVVVIDHHETRKEYIKIADDVKFSINNSGCVLAWKYFFPNKKIPKILLYIENMDLWKWKLRHSREIANYIESYNFTFKNYDRMARELENKEKFKKCLAEGKIIERYKKALVDEILHYAEEVILDGQKAFAVSSPIMDSEIGNRIYRDKKAIGIIWRYKNKKLRVSLRSDKVDVSKLAQKYGGGGHKRSSGFMQDAEIKFPWQKKNSENKNL